MAQILQNSDSSDDKVLELSTVILGSLAQSGMHSLNKLENEIIFKALLDADTVKLLFDILKNGDLKLKENVARTLKAIFRHSKAPRHVVFHPPFLALFTSLMENSQFEPSLLNSVASILASACDSQEKQLSLLSDGFLICILNMLSSNISKVNLP